VRRASRAARSRLTPHRTETTTRPTMSTTKTPKTASNAALTVRRRVRSRPGRDHGSCSSPTTLALGPPPTPESFGPGLPRDTPVVHAWNMLTSEPRGASAEVLLARLRGEGDERPAVDPGLAGGLRDWFEEALGAAGGCAAQAPAVRVTKEAVNQVLVCEAHAVSRAATPRAVTVEIARGVLVDALFRQWVTLGSFDEPWTDAVAAVECADDGAVLHSITDLDAPGRDRLAEEVREHAARIASAWPVSSPGWLARTQERLEVPLGGGRLVLSGVVDLAFGAPCAGRASVCLVELKSGARRLEHRGDLHYYALLETLRSGAPPFRIATYYSATGELDAEQVGEDVLLGAMHRTIAASERLCRLAAGAEPARTPNPLCAWCAELARCGPGQGRARSQVPKKTGDPTAGERVWTGDPSWEEEEVV